MTAQTLQVIGPLANTLAWVFAENIGWEKSLWATTSLRNIITGRRRKKKRNEAEDVPIWGYVSEVSAAWNLVNWCPQKVCCYSGNWGGTGVKGLPKTDTVERMVQNKSLRGWCKISHWQYYTCTTEVSRWVLLSHLVLSYSVAPHFCEKRVFSLIFRQSW